MEELVDKIYKELKCKHGITKEYIKVIVESISRFEQKQDVYETENISNTGEIGILTRIGDAFYEIKKYLQVNEDKRSELRLTKEKITKDFMDISVFGIIGYIYMNDKWK